MVTDINLWPSKVYVAIDSSYRAMTYSYSIQNDAWQDLRVRYIDIVDLKLS